MDPGALLTLDIEKPAAGGRMIARHHGEIVLVEGAIPGERVVARVERRGKGVAFAGTIDVLSPSPDRRATPVERRCGGNALAHVRYERQLALKAEIIRDAFARLGRLPLSVHPAVQGSPETGYRMRARLHARGFRLGFFRDGTHDLCDVSETGQLLPATEAWIADAQETLRRENPGGLRGVEIAENVAADERVCHLEIDAGARPHAFAALARGLTGLSADHADRGGHVQISGVPSVTDVLHPREDGQAALRLRHGVRAFFQGNRFLLEPLVRQVVALVPAGPVLDLYAGGGIFGLSAAAAGIERVTLVEGDPASGADLESNAAPFADRVRIERRSVEAFSKADAARGAFATVIVDPPRTGLSREGLAGVLKIQPSRIVYVSCDVATLARDARAIADAGYAMHSVTGLDLFPNTAHVETIVVFDSAGR